jgi:tetratricopeptide (TPR) repeat protein
MRPAVTILLIMATFAPAFGAWAAPDSGTDISVAKVIAKLEKQAAQLAGNDAATDEIADLYMRIGDLYLETNDLDKAIAAYVSAIKVRPDPGTIEGTARRMWMRTKDPLSAAAFLRKAPIDPPEMARGLMWAVDILVSRLHDPQAALTRGQAEGLVDAAEEVLTAIAVMHKNDEIGDEAALRVLKVRWPLDEMRAREGTIRWEDMEQTREELLRRFAREHEGSPIASRARMEAAEILRSQSDWESARKEWQAVIDDEQAAGNDRFRATVEMAHSLVGEGRYDEAEPLLTKAVTVEPDNMARGAVARAWLDLGKIQRKRGEAEAAKASFERALQVAPEWDRDLRAEAKAAARLAGTGAVLRVQAYGMVTYEPPSGSLELRAGAPCTVQHTAWVAATVLACTDESLGCTVLFTANEPLAVGGPTPGTQLRDDSGFHVKCEGAVAVKEGRDRTLHAGAMTEKKTTTFPLSDVSMKVESVMEADGVVALSIEVAAPEGGSLTVECGNVGSVIPESISPRPSMDLGVQISFGPTTGTEPVTYKFKVRPRRQLTSYVPKLTLHMPFRPASVKTETPPAEPVKEITGQVGEMSYCLSSPMEFLLDEWTVQAEMAAVVIPEMIR